MSNEKEYVEILGYSLPKDVIVHILEYLNKEDLKRVSLVNKQFKRIADHPSLWLRLRKMAALPPLSTVIQSLPFPPPAALQTTLPAATTVAPGMEINIHTDSTITVPVLPESIPLIAEVPDVVEKELEDKETPVVEISQVLPGYAPSYAQDYIPPQVNGQAMTTFANTISFNVSRYPTLTEITDSKNYNSHKTSDKKFGSTSPPPNKKAKLVSTAQSVVTQVEYIPAEYGMADPVPHIVTVSAAQSVSIVKPEVLSSGRLLTNMTPEIRETGYEDEDEEGENGDGGRSEKDEKNDGEDNVNGSTEAEAT